MTIPYATQALSKTNQVVRTGTCPEHEAKSTLYLGAENYNTTIAWKFRCKKPLHPHTFINYADRSAPKSTEEVALWMENQRMSKVLSFDKNKRTKR